MSLRREDWDPAVLSSPCNGCGGDNDERGFINPYWSCLMRNASSDKARQFFTSFYFNLIIILTKYIGGFFKTSKHTVSI